MSPKPSEAIRTIRVAANGLTFSVDECGEGDRLALCLHGFPESSFSYRYQLPLLARLGYRAWAPDMRGYGESSRPRGVSAYTVSKLREDVAGLIDASRAKSVLLIGHDWGGGVAWSTAIQHTRPIERLIIMNAPHPMSFMRNLFRPAQLLKSYYIGVFQLPWLPEALLRANRAERIAHAFVSTAVDKSRFPEAVTEVSRKNALIPGALTAMLNYYRAMPLAFLDPSNWRTPVLDTPTLLIWGEEDAALTKQIALDTRHYVKDLTLRFLPGVSHWVQQEAPEQVNDLIESWLTTPQTSQPAAHANLV